MPQDSIYCSRCGTKHQLQDQFCMKCGARLRTVDASSQTPPENIATTSSTSSAVPYKKSERSAVTALLLCLFLGTLGIHRFYVGKIGTGILMLLTGGGLGIWALIDLIVIACGSFTDSDGNYLEFKRTAPSTFIKVILIIGLVLASFILFVLTIVAIAFYATSGVVTTVRSQLDALRSHDFVKAYSYTSKEFQNVMSFEQFKTFIEEHPALKNNKDSTFTQREIANNRGKVKGTLEATDGTLTPVLYRLIKENNQWKIIYIKLNPSGIETKDKTSPSTSNKLNSNVTLPK